MDFNPALIETYVWNSPNESELVNVFATVTDRDIDPDNDEVDEGRWWTRREVAEAIGKGVLTPQFEQEFNRIQDRLFALL